MNIFRRYTLKSLWQNRTRTIVTIIGIILSVAMITAVTTTVSSLQNFMLEVTIQEDGCWHVQFMEQKKGEVDNVLAKEEVEESAEYADIAFARLETVKRMRTPYLYIGGYSGDFSKYLSVRVTEGRLPENSHELILPSDFAERSGISYQVGQKLELETGIRKENTTGDLMWMDYNYDMSENPETFVPEGRSQYEIVGFYESAQFGYWGSSQGGPGYEALTRLDDAAVTRGNRVVYMTMKDPGQAAEFEKKLLKEYGEDYLINKNNYYLKMTGSSLGESMEGMLAGLMAVLIGIIMFGSISLIYNSFAISVNERKKQYGLLSSIGATRKQLRKSVIFEAAVVSLIGVPLGVLAGIGGMGVTFYCLRDMFSEFLTGGGNTGIGIHVSAALWSVVLAAAVGFITVLISAYLPVRKALKINAIEAIRQTTDIVVKPRRLKTSRLTVKLFGLEGVLASKNYKRNKRKYRATVFSLFISVVLFISASSFSDYLSTGLEDIIGSYTIDLQYSDTMAGGKKSDEQHKELFDKFSQIEVMTESYYNINLWNESMVSVPGKYLSDLVYHNSVGEDKPKDDKSLEQPVNVNNVSITFIQEDVYREYLEKNHLDVDRYMNTSNPVAIAYDKATVWDSEKERYENVHTFLENPKSLQLGFEIWPEEENDDQAVSEPDVIGRTTLSIGEIREEAPAGLDIEKQAGLVIMYPAGAMDIVCAPEIQEQISVDYSMSFCAKDASRGEDEMQEIMDGQGIDGYINNIQQMIRINRALMTILNIFSYGFIVLISLIAAANVFNTISTNVLLRRREFAMLRSVGMTQKSFHKMTNFECLLYGVKGLVYGLPVAVGITALIWKSMNSEIAMKFYIPWYSVVIAAGSVFLVVFATMLYSMSKIRKDNVVETLKEENY